MIVLWGTRLYGRVDEVEGLGWVATRFAHLCSVPLIPGDSYLVFEQREGEWHGARIPRSPKSIGVAYLRAACLLGLICGVGAILSGAFSVGAALLAFAGSGLAALYALGAMGGAGFAQAERLMDQAGVPEDDRIRVAFDYGQIDEEEAARRLTRLACERLGAAITILPRPRRKRTPKGRFLEATAGGRIRFACPRCEHVSKVPTRLAGRKGRCKGCDEPVRVPRLESTRAAA